MDWTAGYVAEIDYTHGYYRHLSPGSIDFALLLSGHEPPDRAQTRYLELGFGQGLSANIHAAAVAGEFWGADFNPSHAANARSLAAHAGSNGRFFDDSFAAFAERQDSPEFDYIALHGVWSWISDENRAAVLEIVRRRLKIGGAFYISYNVLPGWAPAMPLRRLMVLHAETAGAQAQGVVGRIDASIAFASKLAEAGARFFTANPAAKGKLDGIAGQDRNYLAHEYFNRDWEPTYFAAANAELSEAKLSFACSAGALDQIDGFNLTPAQQEVLASLTHTALRQTVRDFMLNEQFRRDVFTRGARRLTPLERMERLSEVSVTLIVEADAVPFEVDAGLGKVGLKKEIYEPILAALAENAGVRIGDLMRRPSLAGLTPQIIVEAIAVLIGAGHAHPAQSPEQVEIAAPRCERLNARLIERARVSGDSLCLASPTIGAGVPVGRFEQMFLGARGRALKTPQAWASDAWECLHKQNQTLLKNGAPLKTAEENLEELGVQAKAFADKRLSTLARLKVVA